jgi:hypothetical protein
MLFVAAVVLTLSSVRRAHASSDNDDLRPDVLACEEAVKHLVDCCPGFDAKAVTCTYYFHDDSGCGQTEWSTESPTYDEDQSACIVAMDCNRLNATGVCQRAQTALTPSSSCTADEGDNCVPGGVAYDYSEVTPKGPVCP